MRYFATRVVICAGILLIASASLEAQTNPFGGDLLPKADNTTIPLDDVQVENQDGKDAKLPEGVFDDKDTTKVRDATRAPKDGGADFIQGTGRSDLDLERGLRLLDEGEWQDAIDYLNDAIETNPRSAKALVARARAQSSLAAQTSGGADRSTMLDKAVADASAAIKLSPRDKHAYLIRGIAQRLQSSFKQANASFTFAIEIDSKFADAYVRRGIVLFYLNPDELAPAIFDFDNAIRLNRNDYRAHLWRGLLYSRSGEYDQAITSFDQALRAQPEYAPALANRGLAHLKLEQLDKALADLTELTRVAEDDKKAFFKRGVVESELGQYDDAITSFKKAITLDSDYAQAFYNRSVAYAKIDELEKSDADYKTAVRLDPNLRD